MEDHIGRFETCLGRGRQPPAHRTVRRGPQVGVGEDEQLHQVTGRGMPSTVAARAPSQLHTVQA
jgi:hypothetical protein